MLYMKGIRMRGGTEGRLIGNEIMLILSDSQLVFDPLDRWQDPPQSQLESHTIPRGDVPEEKLHHSPIIGDNQSPSSSHPQVNSQPHSQSQPQHNWLSA